MSKIDTNKEKIKEVLERGVEIIYPNRESLEKKLLSGEQLTIYAGFDPSAPSLHIGNAILVNKLAQFQKLGHKIIFLIGDFTGMIGDPTDKKATRKQLSREEVLANSRLYTKQASCFLDFEGENKAEVKYNSAWLDNLNFRDLIELSANFTVQQMIQRDMFQERLREGRPIHLHEFLYPLAQAYDSVALNVDLEIGGNDQMFNMMCGRDLMKAIKKKEKFVLTMKLLADDSGKKMGKSEGNAVFLDQEARDIYGRVMSWNDSIIPIAFELCTNVPMEDVKKIKQQLKEEKVNPRDLKMKLAFEITKAIHGEKEAQDAQEYFVKTFQQKRIPKEITEKTLKKSEINIIDLLLETDLAESRSEAKRLVKQRGVKINGDIVDSIDKIVKIDDSIIVQRGKKFFIKVKSK